MKSYREYFYPGTDTLQNRLGIRDANELAIAEAELTRHRMRESIGDIPMTPEGLRKTHHHIFQDVYSWAGEFRRVNMVKVQSGGAPSVRFAPGGRVERVEVPRFFGELQSDLKTGIFQGLDRSTFGYRAAVYMADLNYIHPFPEGNGRTQRIFLKHLADHAGYKLDHARIDRQAWMQAAIESYGQQSRGGRQFGAHEKMTALIEKAIKPEPSELAKPPLGQDRSLKYVPKNKDKPDKERVKSERESPNERDP